MLRHAHFLFLLLLLAGCRERPAPENREQRTLTDALGRKIELGEVRRVVSIAPSATEILFAAGGGSRLVGASTVDDYPPAVTKLPRYGIGPVDVEAVAALRPDLVLASEQVNNPREAETLAALGIPTLFLPAESLDDVYASIRLTGTALGTEQQATRAVDSLRARVDSLRNLTADVQEKPRVLVLISPDPLYAFGRDSYVHEIIELAGGRSLTREMQIAEPVLSDEFVLRARPDVIVGTFGKTFDPARLRELHPTWTGVPAIRDRRVFTLEESLLQRPGPRLVEAAWIIARRLHPGLIG